MLLNKEQLVKNVTRHNNCTLRVLTVSVRSHWVALSKWRTILVFTMIQASVISYQFSFRFNF